MKNLMKDWRGNKYIEEKLWYVTDNGNRVPVNCDMCLENQAVRNCCTAEGDIGRTHWHGGVHTKDGIKNLCRKCADKVNKRD